MFYIVKHIDDCVCVYDSIDGVSEWVTIKDLADKWSDIGHLFTGKFYYTPDNPYSLTSLNGIPLAPFDIFTKGIDSNPSLSTLLSNFNIFNATDLDIFCEKYQGYYEQDYCYLSANFVTTIRNDYKSYSMLLDDLYDITLNTSLLETIDFDNKVMLRLLFTYFTTALAFKYDKTDLVGFFLFKEVNIILGDGCYVVEYEDSLIPAYYFIASKLIGVVTAYRQNIAHERYLKDSCRRLRDTYPDKIKTISRYTGTMRPIKVEGNKLYLKGAGFYTFDQIAKKLLVEGCS